MKRNQGCHSLDHQIARRQFLAGAAGGAVCLGLSDLSAHAETVKSQHKRILQVYLQGGVSQLESWDPKPGTEFGGPFRAIPTTVPGMHISELLPHTAQRMHLLSIVRSINIKTNDHSQGRLFMEKGRRAGEYPYIGSIASKYLAPANSELPGYIHISTRGLSDATAAFLGAQHAQLKFEGVKPPQNLGLPKNLNATANTRRLQLRQQFNQKFRQGRRKAQTETFDASFQQASKLMARKSFFEKTPDAKDLERYGKHDFGRNCLLARKLLENNATCVKVTHHGYDSHAENFNFHLEQLGEFDKTFSMLLDDLHERGMLESTLVMVYSEFGRTPKINVRYGRDHWGTAWSIALGGCGVQPGAIIGKTNEKGTAVADREVDAGHLFHTYLQALGIDSTRDHEIGGRSIPIGDPATQPIKELLA
ncbi:DUF1501 domain-containing protein [Gimesia chilikensis]|uniref:DUF1501 domain-containing protein n=1 Tax=Gimesia chilikensis TaxID=2605989 RepID=UPI0011895974|nr:DUF1501 domain-containing protein [Gimesia chilikensis]QDT84168.1 hypothetical protein MalM14_18200 [Gimesia chilikensis]